MNERIEINYFRDPAAERKLDDIANALALLEKKLMAIFDDLTAKLKSLTDADDAVAAVLMDIRTKLTALSASTNLSPDDQAKLDAIVKSIDDETTKMVSAAAATPASPPAPGV